MSPVNTFFHFFGTSPSTTTRTSSATRANSISLNTIRLRSRSPRKMSNSEPTEFLSVLHSHKRATFIGEETGGSYYGNTSGIYRANLELPNSKLKLHFGL